MTKIVLICFSAKGKTQEEIESERARVTKKATRATKEEGAEIFIVDPFGLDSAPQAGEKDDISFICDIIGLVKTAEVSTVYFAAGWSADRYCKVLFSLCQQYGIKYISE